jgi:hypothetical protein
LITHAFEDLAQSLRVLLEADFRARTGLLSVDRPEAVGNIETALGSVLHGFHSLYDSTGKEPGYEGPDWYAEPALSTVLAIRNARHHNKANRIRTLYTFHAQEAPRPNTMQQYVFVDFASTEEGGDTFDVFLSWSDFKEFLALPVRERRIRDAVTAGIIGYLGADRFFEYAEFYELPEHRVFFNVVPLFLNAGLAIMPSIRNRIQTNSVEAQHFKTHFSIVGRADTGDHEVIAGPFVLPE